MRTFGLRVPKTQYCEFMSPFSLNRFQFYTSGVKYMLQLLQTFTDFYRHLQTFTDIYRHFYTWYD
ncbi:hypothetical protein HanXRQr2_Chr01g0019511 [Helianthus annuus]|uniref:Uncharacterized protein n=1 Tax=Helianthus annuus TaxID=4232 RepID=A0A9K3JV26_HELAN|nr:hypothetical protein HanXRQr2_Chr01g0019511 [Helianthus annuus]